MTVLGKDKIHYIEKILLYTPIMVGVFIALSVWGKGLTFGFMGVGFILLGVLIDNVKKVAGNHSHFIPSTYSILFIAITVYLWAMGSIYEGIFYALIGMNLIFDRHLKGKWKHICCAIAIGLAMLIFILYIWKD